jgi:hypothetical protein
LKSVWCFSSKNVAVVVLHILVIYNLSFMQDKSCFSRILHNYFVSSTSVSIVFLEEFKGQQHFFFVLCDKIEVLICEGYLHYGSIGMENFNLKCSYNYVFLYYEGAFLSCNSEEWWSLSRLILLSCCAVLLLVLSHFH